MSPSHNRNRKTFFVRFGVIVHLGNVGRILEKRAEHSATPRILHASLVFSQHFSYALSYPNARNSFFISQIIDHSCQKRALFIHTVSATDYIDLIFIGYP